MQLNEILEENSIKSISKKTNISEENLEALFNSEFALLTKVKTMGFISIIEREYGADLSAVRQAANGHYDEHKGEESIMIDAPVVERRRGSSKLKVVIVLLLLGVVSWYFIAQFDQEKLRGFLPFNEEKVTQSIEAEVSSNPDLSIEHAISTEAESPKNDDNTVAEETTRVIESNQSNEE